MPRKKTIQPPPLDSFTLDDGTVVEVRDEKCRVVGRGLHKQDAYLDKRDKVLELVANDYLTPKGRKHVFPEHDYLLRSSTFAIKAAEWGLLGKDGSDDSSLRKKLYRDIKQHIDALSNAIEQKSNS